MMTMSAAAAKCVTLLKESNPRLRSHGGRLLPPNQSLLLLLQINLKIYPDSWFCPLHFDAKDIELHQSEDGLQLLMTRRFVTRRHFRRIRCSWCRNWGGKKVYIRERDFANYVLTKIFENFGEAKKPASLQNWQNYVENYVGIRTFFGANIRYRTGKRWESTESWLFPYTSARLWEAWMS